MKNHPWLVGFIALSLATGGCGNAATKDSSTATAGDSKSAAPKDGGKKSDAKADSSGKADAKADSSAQPGASASGQADAKDTMPLSGGAPSAAMSHLSDDCVVAARVDLGQLVANPSFQKEIVPGLDEILATASPKDKSFVEFQTFLKDTGIDYKKSIHDVAVCISDVNNAEKTWSVIVGMDVKPGALIEQFEKHAPKSGGGVEDLDGRKVFVKDGVTLGEGDGVVILAANKDVFKKTLAAKGASAYKLDTSKYLAFVVREQAVKLLLSKNHDAPEGLKGLKSVRGGADLASLKTEVVGECGTPDDAKNLDAVLTVAKGQFTKPGSNNPAAEALKGISSHIDGSNVIVDIVTPQDSFDQGLKMIGLQLKDAKTKI